MNDKIYQIRKMERHNIETTFTMSETRVQTYLAAMRDRFNQPTWNFSRLLPRVLREWYALYASGQLPGGDHAPQN